MHLLRKGSCVSLLFSAALLPTLIHATTVLEQTLPGLVRQAEVIAVGTVTGIQEQWDATRQAPITNITFSHLTVLKGDASAKSMTLEFLGGHTPDGRMIAIAGVPYFTMGEKTVVFCAGNRRDFCPLVGIWQGLLRVTFDPQRGVETVSDNFRVPIVEVKNGRLQKRTHAALSQEPLSLPAFLELITQEMRSLYGQP